MAEPAQFPFAGGESGRLIRERNWAETRLGASETWPPAMRATINLMLASDFPCVTFWGPDLLVIYNDAHARLIGDHHPEALGRPARVNWEPRWSEVGPILEAVASGQSLHLKDQMFERPNGGMIEEVHFDIALSPIRDDSGAVLGVMSLSAEVTERVHTQRALEESEARWRELADNISQFAWTADASGSIYWYNRRWHEYTGTTPEQMHGWGWKSVHHPDHLDRVVARISECFRTGEPWEDTFPLRSRHGEYRWFLSRALPIRDAQGRVVRWFGTNTDITAQVDFERLEKSQAQLRSIFETSYQYMGLMTPEGILLEANATALAAIGAQLGDVAGRPVWETPWYATTPGLADALREAVPRAAAGETIRAEMAADLPIGQRAFDFAMRPVRNAAGEVIALLIEAIDITERRAAEEQLRQAQKMEAVGQLTGGLAHDFNNLLTGIIGSFSLVKRRLAAGKSEDTERLLDAGIASARRAASLTQRLLAFSRRQSLDLGAIDLAALVGSMQELLRRTLGEQVQLETALAEGLWPVYGDANQIESALLNFALNARDAMPDGGTLTIAARNVDWNGEGALLAQELELEPQDYVALTVRDTGTGMPPDVLEKAFDPFFTTKPIGQGTGLGLSMAYGYARQSRGALAIESTLGAGTAVTLYMPKARGSAAAHSRAERPEEMAAGGGERVLVVEDDPGVRVMIREVLGELGYATREAADGLEAASILQSDVALDLLVTDVGLPGLNGRQVAEIARQRRPDLKILFMTGYAAAVGPRTELQGPGIAVIDKPFAPEVLAARIRRMLAS